MSAPPDLSGRSQQGPLVLQRVSTWVVIGGSVLGCAAMLSDRVAPKWVGNMAAVWFLAGFLAGLTTGDYKRGIRLGILALVAGNLAYYGLRVSVGALAPGKLVPVPAGWLAVGVVSGAVSGALGVLARTRPAAWGVPAGAFLGEATTVLVLRQRVGQVVVEVLCAAACLWFARAALPRALVVTATTLPYVAGFAVLYRLVLW
jgi:hypothetical protein